MVSKSLQVFLCLMLVVLGSVYGRATINSRAKRTQEAITIEQVTQPLEHGEGPHWDSSSQRLIFVDAHKKRIYSLNSRTGELTYTYIANGVLGVAIPVKDFPDQLIATAGRDFTLVTWDASKNDINPKIKVLASIEPNRSIIQWNDGKVDSSGRFWGGTKGESNSRIIQNSGSLYRITKNLKPETVIYPVSISNGEAWNIEDNMFYYVDSSTYQIVAYNFDSDNGIIFNKRVVFDLPSNNVTGLPDGMTIDVHGNLWVALFGGHSVIHVDPKRQKLLGSIKIPAAQVTSVMFGGPQLDILYVTTSRLALNETQLLSQPKAGSVFAVKGLGVRGFAANSFELDDQEL